MIIESISELRQIEARKKKRRIINIQTSKDNKNKDLKKWQRDLFQGN